jgi:moderate conductance mechanosensitive channel
MGKIESAIIVVDMQELVNKVQQLLDNILSISDIKIVKILIVLLLTLLALKVVKSVIRNTFKLTIESTLYPKHKRDQERRAKTLISIFNAMATIAIWFISILLILNILQVNITAVVASAGFIGAAIAFSTQSLIKDFISGLFIIAENQYRIDDYVQFDKVEGWVEKISVRTTVIRSQDGILHHVPNGSIIITSNLSMGTLKAQVQIEFSAKLKIESFIAELNKICTIIENDPELAKLIKSGPYLDKIEKITKDTVTADIEFVTNIQKRQQATNAIWKLIEQQKIPLA